MDTMLQIEKTIYCRYRGKKKRPAVLGQRVKGATTAPPHPVRFVRSHLHIHRQVQRTRTREQANCAKNR